MVAQESSHGLACNLFFGPEADLDLLAPVAVGFDLSGRSEIRDAAEGKATRGAE